MELSLTTIIVVALLACLLLFWPYPFGCLYGASSTREIINCFFWSQLTCRGNAVLNGPFWLNCCHDFWLDTEGNEIDAHGSSLYQDVDAGIFYWYGESKKTYWGTSPSAAINLYTSTDIAGPWKFVSKIIEASSLAPLLGYQMVVLERPKVIYCAATKKYVLWAHAAADGYSPSYAGVWQSPHPSGPWTFFRQLFAEYGCADLTLFLDPLNNKLAYLAIVELELQVVTKTDTVLHALDSTFTNLGLELKRWKKVDNKNFEGMCMFYESGPNTAGPSPIWDHTGPYPGGCYWIVGTKMMGWAPSRVLAWKTEWGKALDATSNWSIASFSFAFDKKSDDENLQKVIDDFTEHSLCSQPCWIQTLKDAQKNNYFLYMGDNWTLGDWSYSGRVAYDPNGPLAHSKYVWLPFRVDTGVVKVTGSDKWNPANHFEQASVGH